MTKETSVSPPNPPTSQPKPSRWQRFVAAVGNAIGQAKFGQ